MPIECSPRLLTAHLPTSPDQSSGPSRCSISRTPGTPLKGRYLVSLTLRIAAPSNIGVLTIPELPLASRIQLCGEGRTLQPSDLAASLPKFPLSDLSSSPSSGVVPILKWGVEEKATTSNNIREHAQDAESAKYPGSIFAPPTFDAASGYLPSESHLKKCVKALKFS
jgi:hypothetical protein